MDKYAVEMSPEVAEQMKKEMEKFASGKSDLPVRHGNGCGGLVEMRGNVWACENCGTRPFERNDIPISMSSTIKK